MTQFHDTGYGKRFFDGQLPELIKALKDIAGGLRDNAIPKGDKHAGIESLLGKRVTPLAEDIIIFVGQYEDGTPYVISRAIDGPPPNITGLEITNYFVYMNDKRLTDPVGNDSFGSLQEAFEIIANEIGL